MYAYIKGILIEATPIHVIVDVQGVGYHIMVPCSLFGKLPQIGTSVQLHTSFIVRELSQALYGFSTPQEKEAFEILLGVSGIGPKIALSLIGHLNLGDLQTAIAQHNIATLCKVPGIGKKTAERMVIELRDKFNHLGGTGPSDFAVELPRDSKRQQLQDAMMALINLGYNQNAAKKAISDSMKELPEDADLPTLIMASLKNI